jgi:hypothetical protein
MTEITWTREEAMIAADALGIEGARLQRIGKERQRPSLVSVGESHSAQAKRFVEGGTIELGQWGIAATSASLEMAERTVAAVAGKAAALRKALKGQDAVTVVVEPEAG